MAACRDLEWDIVVEIHGWIVVLVLVASLSAIAAALVVPLALPLPLALAATLVLLVAMLALLLVALLLASVLATAEQLQNAAEPVNEDFRGVPILAALVLPLPGL